MSYKSGFLANTLYSAEDVNEVISKIVTKGVEAVDFVGALNYNTSELNRIVQYLTDTNNGVNPESRSTLKVLIEGTNGIKISPGTAFFSTGASITVTSYEVMVLVAGVKNYVYVKHDTSLNTIKPYCTAEAPTGVYVPLAEVSAAGVITDTRTYLQGKVAGYQSGLNRSMKKIIALSLTGEHSILTEFDGNQYNNFVFTPTGNLPPYGVWFDDLYGSHMGETHVTDKIVLSCYNYSYGYGATGWLTVRKVLNAGIGEVWFDYTLSNSVTIDVYAF